MLATIFFRRGGLRPRRHGRRRDEGEGGGPAAGGPAGLEDFKKYFLFCKLR